ncbi:MAG: hypothetical protein ISS17_08150 [Bacteroidales bacterium]|nr:hypothetical protein [Bacteroidales bacterium]
MKFPKGAMAPVYWGIQNPQQPLDQYGDTLGFIPQVAIGESTMSQKEELGVDRETGNQIMTIEQAI